MSSPRRLFRPALSSIAVGLLAGLLAGLSAPAAHAADAAGPAVPPWPQCLAGNYDGGQHEVAARLALDAAGRFVYELSYGALDEMAEGRWDATGGTLTLTSDPVVAPKYSLVLDQPLAEPELRVSLELPRGISAQFFDVLVGYADGGRAIRQMSDEGVTIPLEPGRDVRTVAIQLPIYDVGSDPFLVAGTGGRSVRVRFDPNELGKVAFDRQSVRREGADLLLDRHDVALRFRPQGRGCLGR